MNADTNNTNSDGKLMMDFGEFDWDDVLVGFEDDSHENIVTRTVKRIRAKGLEVDLISHAQWVNVGSNVVGGVRHQRDRTWTLAVVDADGVDVGTLSLTECDWRLELSGRASWKYKGPRAGASAGSFGYSTRELMTRLGAKS